MKMFAQHIIFTGNVQGVGFRFTAFRYAREHNITGFVRNLPDGTVEMFAQGYPQDIEDCISDLRSYFGSYVRKVETQEQPFNPSHHDFKITQ